MNKQYIDFKIIHQKITRTDDFEVVGGSKGYLHARFTFCEDWADEKVRIAIFTGGGVPYPMLLENDSCEIPWEVLRLKKFYVGVVAGELLTSAAAVVDVTPCGVGLLDPSLEPTPTMFFAIMKKLSDAEETTTAEIEASVKAYLGENGVNISDGVLCARIATEIVSGAGWWQKEASEPISEPYLKEWGWRCCEAEGDASMELYRWIYRCAREGFAITQRTIVVNNAENEPIFVDGGDDIGKAVADAQGITDQNGVEAIRRIYPADPENYHILRIPLSQFEDLTEETLKKVLYRVKEDNAELFLLYFPQISETSGTMPIAYSNGRMQYLYTVFPTEEKRREMAEACASAAALIKDKVYYLYGIAPSDTLTEEQRKKVVKLIHDHIILNAELSTKNGVESRGYLSANAYAVLSGEYAALCSGYAQAFDYIAKMYGINSVFVSGIGYKYNGNGGGHAWNAVQMSADGEYVYGDYSSNPAHWAVLDVFWDEPLHETQIGGTPDRDDLIWRYFLDSTAIFAEEGTYPNHTIDYNAGYGALPFKENPSASYPYSGNQIYKWEDEL